MNALHTQVLAFCSGFYGTTSKYNNVLFLTQPLAHGDLHRLTYHSTSCQPQVAISAVRPLGIKLVKKVVLCPDHVLLSGKVFSCVDAKNVV